MVCEKLIDQSKRMDSLTVPKTSEKATAVAPENGIPPRSITAEDSSASFKGKDGQESVAQTDTFNQPSSYYNYYYPGYNGSYGQSNDGRDNSSMGVQADQGSIAYYMPGYNPYPTGAFVGADGHCVSPAYYTSSGYLQPPVTYGTEALPCYAWDMNYLGNPSSNATSATTSNSVPSPATVKRSNGIKPSKLYDPSVLKSVKVSSDSKLRQPVASSNGSRPKFDTQPLKPLNKPVSNFQSASFASAYHPAGNFHSYPYQKRSPFPSNGSMGGSMGYRSNPRVWNGNTDNKPRPNRRADSEIPTELTCGPRAKCSSNSSENEPIISLGFQKDKYNMANFQTDYENAKFYVIKSYSEDDVHKCLKYDVWSSTASGNKKLDAAFHDAEVKISETGVKCPIFLFFSVNGSGQFVGVAEMLGKVDFNKTMDFWQLDKWSGFFPVQWHIVKDIPNPQLKHILLENNENRPVTYTRDTQEIGLKQGLEMLKIFKNYLSKTSLLDDFEFYEGREKVLQNQRRGKHPTEIYANTILPKQSEKEYKDREMGKSQAAAVSSLSDLTGKLTLNSDSKVAL